MRVRRVRVLIYEGDEEWVTTMRDRDWVKDGTTQHLSNDRSISSLESTVLIRDEEK